MAKAPKKAGTGTWKLINGKFQWVPNAPTVSPTAGYTNVPTGGYAPLEDTYTPATGFKQGAGTTPNKPIGGGVAQAKDYNQDLRIASRPDLNVAQRRGSMLPTSNGANFAKVKAMTNQAPTNNPTVSALRAIEGE